MGISIYWNKRQYPGKSWPWVIGKSVLDVALVGVLAAFMPALLLVYSCMFVLDLMTPYLPKDRVLRVTIAVLTGSLLANLGARCLELLLVLGAAGMDLVSGRVLRLYQRYRTA